MWARLLTGRSSECLSNRLTGVKQFTLGKKLRFRAPGASGRTQRGCCSAEEVEGTGLTINIANPGAGANTPGRRNARDEPRRPRPTPRRARRDGPAASLRRLARSRQRQRLSLRRQPSGTRHCRPPKPREAPAAPPASERTRSQFDVTAAIGSRVSGPPLLRHA